jgi:NodT family efflux transporter outer membrane factor (OMF) lipoprotein
MRRGRQALGLAVGGLLLAACAVGPDYRPRRAPGAAAATFSSARADLETSADEPAGAWWRLYHDAGLEAAVAEAMRANTDLRAAESNLLAAEAVLTGTRAGLEPSTQASAGATYGRSQLANQLAATAGRRAHANWLDSTGFAVAYQLDLFGQIRRGVEASRADAEAGAAARDTVRVTVAAQTTAAYADACALGASLAVARRSLELAGRFETATALRKADGVATSLDLARAEALAAQTAAAIPQLEGQRRTALFVLATVMGRPPSQAPAGAVGCATPLRLDAPMPVGDGASLLRRRPDLRQAERNLAAATARIGVATSALFPTITLGGSIALAARSPGDLASHESQSYGLGPSLSWNFPDQTAVRARIRQSRAQAGTALGRLDGTVLQALLETEQALTAYGAERDRHGQLLVAREKSARAFRLASLQRQEGALPYLDLLTAEQSLIAADAAVAASDRAIAADQVAVFKALGGGWEPAA